MIWKWVLDDSESAFYFGVFVYLLRKVWAARLVHFGALIVCVYATSPLVVPSAVGSQYSSRLHIESAFSPLTALAISCSPKVSASLQVSLA